MSDEELNPQAAPNPFATINATNIPKNLLSYDGKLGALFRIYIKNFFLSILTLGIYSSWATNNIRKYTFGSFTIGDDRLEYSGKGGQLFKGALIIGISYIALVFAINMAIQAVFPEEYEEIVIYEEFLDNKNDNSFVTAPPAPAPSPAIIVKPELEAVLLPNGEFDVDGCIANNSAEQCEELYTLHQIELSSPVVVPEVITPPKPQEPELSIIAEIIRNTYTLIAILAVIIFSYYAKFSVSRYRLARAKWRGINGGIRGVSSVGYIGLRLRRLFANIFTLGFLIGRSDLLANKYLLNNAYIGKTKFSFEPDLKKLDKVNLVTLLLAIPTLLLSRFWYYAAFLNYKYQCLSIGGVKFQSSFKGGQLLWLRASNLLIIIFTLFIGTPIAMQRSLKYFAENVRVMGNTDQLNFIQQQSESDTLGEGLEQVLGLGDTGVDMGVI